MKIIGSAATSRCSEVATASNSFKSSPLWSAATRRGVEFLSSSVRIHLTFNPVNSRESRRSQSSLFSDRGFTLIELLIVISIILILTTVLLPNYQISIRHAKEAVLKDDLYQLRSLIDQYTVDKQKAPQSLDDLVTAGYIREIPKDPFTNSNQTWKVNFDDSVSNPGQSESGIVDVHSGAPGSGIDGTAYTTW